MAADGSSDDAAALDALPTEAARPELADFDEWPTARALEVFVADNDDVTVAVRRALPQVAAAADEVSERLAAGGRLIYVGAGSGGRLATLDAAEIGPSYGVRGAVVAVFAGGAQALMDGREHYEDDAEQGAREVDALVPTTTDVVFGISASGRTPFVLGGVSAGRRAGAHTIGFACVAGSPLATGCDQAIEVVTGPEIIAGSTRLKAGSAQKLVLNAISTLAMIRLGHTYGNLMVGLAVDNGKLRRRAVRAVTQAADVDERAAEAALDAADGDVKVALVMALTGAPVAVAARALAQAGGRVRRAAAALAAVAD